jgi:cellulose synthase/poly-beta-1,6-N-acetylglucosamine synthase-like glycosyltransferase/peptidoglycan/xylan/chitin deacetylase (PgdA/CDA1 family)
VFKKKRFRRSLLPNTRIFRKYSFRFLVFGILALITVAFTDFVAGVVAERQPSIVDPGYYRNVMANDKIVVLTFDDGPDPQKTQQIVEVLDRQEVPATFFFMGSHALMYPEIVREVNNKGYEIGNHTYSHSHNVHDSEDRLAFELDVTNKIIGNITGEPTLLYRPPYLLDIGSDPVADPGGHSIKLEWAERNGYIPVGADIDSLDWAADSSQEVVDNVLNNLENGHIVLLHDGGEGEYTVEALDPLITELKARGYRFGTVSDVIGLNAAPTMTVTKDLQPGDTDATTDGDVTRLQTFLLKEGALLMEPSGVFDEDTLLALQNWQISKKIENDKGVVTSVTREKIKENLDFYTPHATWPSLLSHANIERSVQNNLIKVTSLTEKNIPLVTKVILLLVIGRLFFVLFLLILNKIKPMVLLTHWRGGVSVIIPAFNEEENIAGTIYSVLQNKRKKLEIIVVDDGSTDNTVKVARKIRRKYKDIIKVIKIKNSGKAAALNRGIKEAKYGVIVTMDGDTIFTPTTISHLVRHFGNPNVAGVGGKVSATESRNFINIFQQLEYVIAQNVDKVAFNYLNGVGVVPGPVGAWRKSTLLQIGGYSQSTLVEDQDLTMAVIASGHKVVYEPLAVAYTETPFTISDFVKQRMRWVYGTIQCFYKYLFKVHVSKSHSLRFVLLPNTFIYSILLPLFYPLLDIVLVFSLMFSFVDQYWIVYFIFMIVDLGYAIFAFAGEKTQKRLLLWLPLQRLFYRFIIYYVVSKSIVKAIEGSEAFWSKVRKRGDASRYHLELVNRKLALDLVSTN